MDAFIKLLEERAKTMSAPKYKNNPHMRAKTQECKEIIEMLKNANITIHAVSSNEGGVDGVYASLELARAGKEKHQYHLGMSGSHCIAGVHSYPLIMKADESESVGSQ